MYFYSTPSLICALIFFVAARYPHTARAVEMLDVQRLQPPQQGRSPALAMRAGTGQQQQQDRSWDLPVPQLPPLSDVRTYSSDSFLGRARGGDGPRSMLRGSSGDTVPPIERMRPVQEFVPGADTRRGSALGQPNDISSGRGGAPIDPSATPRKEIISRAALWLDAAEGVLRSPADGSVTRWQSRKEARGVLGSTSELIYFEALHGDTVNKAAETYIAESDRQRSRGGVSSSNLRRGMGAAAGITSRSELVTRWTSSVDVDRAHAAVVFPCSMHSIVPIKLSAPLTAMFVINPRAFGGEHAVGQRFFGFYPNGQFRFRNGKPSFFAYGVDFDLPEGVADKVNPKAGQFMVLVYRFDGKKVEVSYNGAPFACISCDGMAASLTDLTNLFTPLEESVTNRILTVGGVQPTQCGFDGHIAEIILFPEALMNFESTLMVKYLSSKYGIAVESTAGSQDTGRDRGSRSRADDILGGEKLLNGLVVSGDRDDNRVAIKSGSDSSDNIRTGGINIKDLYKNREPVVVAPQRPAPRTVPAAPLDGDGFRVPEDRVGAAVIPNPESSACTGASDPFAGQSIETFKPPKGAGFSDIMKWEDARKDMIEGIKRMKIGGNALRDIIHKEVRRMQLLRFEIFCKYV